MSYSNQAWNQPQQGENVPRRPNATTESLVLNIVKQNEQLGTHTSTQSQDESRQASAAQQSSQPLTLPVLPSQLSANAKEFVPRAQSASSTYTDDPAGLSANAPVFVPRAEDDYSGNGYYIDSYSTQSYNQDYSSNHVLDSFGNMSLQDNYAGGSGDSILDKFNNALYILNMSPGHMKDYLMPVCNMICKSGNPGDMQSTMNNMVEGLFEQSILEPNFRYTGARVCQFLNKNLKGNEYFSGFHEVLMKRCQKEYERREELIKGGPEERQRLMGLAMFMAEIFLNVEVEEKDGSVSRGSFLPQTLIDFIHTLLSHPMEQEVKCCCQLLKLSGALIEDVAKESPDMCQLFENIFAQLATLKTRPELPDNTKVLVGSVIQLKAQNWNRSTPSPPKKSVFSFNDSEESFQQEPVFYTANGAMCSRAEAGFTDDDGRDYNAYVLNDEEEAAFLEWQAEQEGLSSEHQGAFNDTGYDSYQLDEIPDEGGMGEELEAAFEEFLQEQTMSQGMAYPQQVPQQQVMPDQSSYQPQIAAQYPPQPHAYYQGTPPMPFDMYSQHMNQPPQPPHRMSGPPPPQQQQGYPPYNDPYHYNKR